MSSTPILDPTWVAQQALRVNEGQVAGHPGSLQSLRGPNGEALIIKQSLDGEVAFYEMLRAADSSNTAAPLLEWIPRYYGSLPPASPDDKPSVILEDLLSKYKRPNVLDIKLGTQLWDDKSSEDKKRRMEEASRNTTSFETGIRLTGWRTWNPHRNAFIPVSKSFGKSIKAEGLHLGLKAFFDLFDASTKDKETFLDLARSTQSIAETDLPDTVAPHPTATFTNDANAASNDDKDVAAVLRQVLVPALDRLIALLTNLEIRIRGGSLLIVYEGDSEARRSLQPQHVMSVRLIDFAHATIVPGQGPDTGVLLGLQTVKRLINDIAASS